MNYTYQSQLANQRPASAPFVATAREAMSRSPWQGFAGPHKDIMRGRGMQNAALFGLAASKENNDFDTEAQQKQNQLALGGLQLLAQQQQNENSLANTRLGMVAGLYNTLLSGLYG